MRRELLMAEVARTPWAVDPAYGERAMAVLERWSRGDQAPAADLQLAAAAREQRSGRPQGPVRGGIAVLPMHGVIMPKSNLIMEFSGGTSCQVFAAHLREAIADEAVGQVLIDIDSPGGSVHGVQELASELMQARTQKPIIGIANHVAASAAYWLGACCTELYVSPSGEVGSIGVYQQHDDLSEAMKKAGVKRTYISSGKHKIDGNPAAPLDPAAKAYMQSQSDEYYRAFVAAVARGRGVSVDRVRAGFGAGRMLLAQAAKAEGMVDGIISFHDLVRELQVKPRIARAPGARASSFPRAISAAAATGAEAARRREIEILSLT